VDDEIKVTYLIEAVDNATKKIEAIEKNLGSMKKSFEDAGKTVNKNLEKPNSVLKELIKGIAKVTALTAGFGAASYGVSKFGQALSKANFHLAKFGIKSMNSLGKMPNLALAAGKSINAIVQPVSKLGTTLVGLNKFLLGVHLTLRDVLKQTLRVGNAFVEAASYAEPFQQGLYGLISKMTVLGALATGLGFQFIQMDSIFAKITGGSLILLSLALGAFTYVLQQTLVLIGDFITRVGTSLVNAMKASVKEMSILENTTASFEFVIRSLDEATNGAIGTVEEWNKIVNDYSKEMRFSREETQRSVSELLRFGDSIGLTKKQMLSLMPVIADLAKANHKDLFQSTLAVVEALNGQTMMLQNMGVNLTQHAIKESKLGKVLKDKITTMSHGEQVQLRYNVLLQKSALLAGLAAKTGSTLEEILKRQQVEQQNLNAALGKGANIIEMRVNVAYSAFLKTLNAFSNSILSVLGFLTALTGRVMQVTGVFLKWSLVIVLVTTSIKALNVLLASNVIQNYIIMLGKSVFVTQKLAKVSQALATTVSTGLIKIGVAGLTLNSILAVLWASMVAIAKQAFIIIAPFLVIIAKLLILVGVIYLVYKALVVLEKKTKAFSNTWAVLVGWWKETAPLVAAIKGLFNDLVDLLQRGLLLAINVVAFAILTLIGAFIRMGRQAIEIAGNIKKRFLDAYQTIAKIAGKFSLISTAEAAEIEKAVTNEKIKQSGIVKSLIEKEMKIKGVKESIIKDIKKIWNGEYRITEEKRKQLEADIKKHTQQQNYIEALSKIHELEKNQLDMQRARFTLAIREAAIKVTGSKGAGQIAEGVYGGLASGSAQQVKGTVTNAMMSSGDPYAMAAAGIIEVFGKGQEEFKKFTKELVNMSIDLPIQIADNIPVLIDAVIKALPKIIDSINRSIPLIVDNFMKMLSDPKFWRALLQTIVKTAGSPYFWLQLVPAIAGAFIVGIQEAFDFVFSGKWLDKSIEVLTDGFNKFVEAIGDAFKWVINAITNVAQVFWNVGKFFFNVIKIIVTAGGIFGKVGKVFSDVGKIFKKVYEGFKKLLSLIPGVGGGGGGGFFSSAVNTVKNVVESLLPFANGGIPALRANNGLLVPGNSMQGDKVPIRVNSREMILTLNQQKWLFDFIKNGRGENDKPSIINVEVPVKINERELGRAFHQVAVNGWAR
jgi:hypothetical protein